MIYFDMDDVTVRFTERINEIFGSNYKIGESMHISEWDAVRKNYQRIFRELKPYEDVVELIKSLPRYKVAMLTALPFDHHSPWQYAAMDKFEWCQKCLPGIPMFIGPYAHDKWKHCKEGDILIDDKASNCEEWESAAGKAFLYRGNFEEMKQWVKENS